MKTITYTNGSGTAITLHSSTAPVGGLFVEGISGFGGPPIDVHTQRAPYQEGQTLLATRPGMRTLSQRQTVTAAGPAALETALTNLADVLDPAHGMGTLAVVREDNTTRSLACIVSGGTEFERDASEMWTARAPLAFLAPDPRWYTATAVVTTFTGAAGGVTWPATYPITWTATTPVIGSTYTFTYTGTAASDPTFVLTGPMLAPRLTCLTPGDDYGKVVSFLGNIPVGATLTVAMDFGGKVWTLAAYGTSYEQTPPAGNTGFFRLRRGTNTILITNSGPGLGGVATMTYRTRFVSL